MNSERDSRYRLAVAIGFRDEAADDFSRRSWRACVEHAQLAVENAAKAIVACFQPVGQTHRPQDELARILSAQTALTTDIQESLNDIIAICRSLSGREHVLAAYGDERARRTPWELFTDVQATFALAQAREAVRQAERVIDCFYPPASTS